MQIYTANSIADVMAGCKWTVPSKGGITLCKWSIAMISESWNMNKIIFSITTCCLNVIVATTEKYSSSQLPGFYRVCKLIGLHQGTHLQPWSMPCPCRTAAGDCHALLLLLHCICVSYRSISTHRRLISLRYLFETHGNIDSQLEYYLL